MVGEITKARTLLNTPYTFPMRDAGNGFYVCPYKHIFRLHPQHTCRRSCHSHQSATAKLFYCAFRRFSSLCFIFPVHISVSNFQPFTTIFSLKYYAFYLLFFLFPLSTLNSSFFSVPFPLKHILTTKIESLQTSQLLFNLFRDSLNVNGYLVDVFTTECTHENKLNSTEVFSAWMTFLKRA